MSKSLGNIYTIADVIERGIHPLSYRYFNYQAHYRTPLSFSWSALDAAQTALYRVWEATAELCQSAEIGAIDGEARGFRERFHEAVNRDLDMPGAVAVLHAVLSSKLPAAQKLALLRDFDRVLALDLLQMASRLSELRTGEEALLQERGEARKAKDWARSDELRARLAAGGLEVKDTAQGQRWLRRDVLPASRIRESEETGGA
jgi:cysteinyl-tRNA synthetase